MSYRHNFVVSYSLTGPEAGHIHLSSEKVIGVMFSSFRFSFELVKLLCLKSQSFDLQQCQLILTTWKP